jgi:hypothetical protein
MSGARSVASTLVASPDRRHRCFAIGMKAHLATVASSYKAGRKPRPQVVSGLC